MSSKFCPDTLLDSSSQSSSSILNHPRLAHLRSLDFVYAAEADYDDDVVVDEGGAAAIADGDDGDDLGQIGGTGRLQKAARWFRASKGNPARHHSSSTIQEKMLTIIVNYLWSEAKLSLYKFSRQLLSTTFRAEKNSSIRNWTVLSILRKFVNKIISKQTENSWSEKVCQNNETKKKSVKSLKDKKKQSLQAHFLIFQGD